MQTRKIVDRVCTYLPEHAVNLKKKSSEKHEQYNVG